MLAADRRRILVRLPARFYCKSDRWGGRPQRHQCATVRVVRTCREGAARVSISMIGLDTAKTVFQVHGVNETGKVGIRRKLRRSELIPFFEKQQACTVVMEACGVGHHWRSG